MASYDDLADSEPPSVDPYEVLGIDKEATADQVKSAYRKAALKHHPDKVSQDKKDEAKVKFQEIAFAYAVLSDPKRRKRYDETGSTSEAIVDSDGFSWSDYYRAQFEDAISESTINKFAAQYKGSEEERDDILAAYEKYKGSMNKIYSTVMLSDVLKDDDRIRKIIDDAIASGEVNAFAKYTKEKETTKKARVKAAQEEAREADELAKELGVYDKLRGKKNKKDSEGGLAALIRQRQQTRADAFDLLAEKYAGKPSKSGKKRAAKEVEPDIPDDQFEAIQAKIMKKARKR